ARELRGDGLLRPGAAADVHASGAAPPVVRACRPGRSAAGVECTALSSGPSTMNALQATIDRAFDDRGSISPSSASAGLRDAVAQVIADLDAGRVRVAEKIDGA